MVAMANWRDDELPCVIYFTARDINTSAPLASGAIIRSTEPVMLAWIIQ